MITKAMMQKQTKRALMKLKYRRRGKVKIKGYDKRVDK